MPESEASNFIKKARVFSCEFCEILRTPFLKNTSGRLLLSLSANGVQFYTQDYADYETMAV